MRFTNGLYTSEKILDITNHQRNANQNHQIWKNETLGYRRYGKIGTLSHYWWECKMVQLLWKTVWQFLKKLKIGLPYDPSIPLLVFF